MRWGPLPVSTLPAAVLTVIAPRPLLRGDALLRIWHLRPAALNTRPCVLLASGTQAPKALKIGKSLRCTDTAYPGKAVAVGPPDHHRTKQVGRHQAVLDRTAEAENLGMVGPKARE